MAPPAVQPPPPHTKLKLISLGSDCSGKSCLIKRYCEDRFFPKYVPTIGVDYGVKRVLFAGKDLRLHFWDLSGRPEFPEVRNEFYKDTQGCILVVDATSRGSFDALEAWIKEAQKFGAPPAMPIVVCINKIDAPARIVTLAEVKRWADPKGYPVIETSAESGAGVKQAFESLLALITK
jgi:DnaJ family protein C protein 27